MKLEVFSVYDSKVGLYLTPFFALSAGAAVRMFSDAANSDSHDFHRHGGDFTLFHLGAFLQEDATFVSLDAPINLGTALSFREDS